MLHVTNKIELNEDKVYIKMNKNSSKLLNENLPNIKETYNKKVKVKILKK